MFAMPSHCRQGHCIALVFSISVITLLISLKWTSRMSGHKMVVFRKHSLLSIAEKGEQRDCVDAFLYKYGRICQETMHPHRSNVLASGVVDWTFWMNHRWNEQLLCPCVPGELVGFVDDGLVRDSTTDDGNSSITVDNLPVDGISMSGGRWLPNWCVARQRVAIVIPFRDRESHLKLFLRRIRPVLRRQLLDFTIFVVEQLTPTLFNRGALINVGYLEASKRAHFDCYILHDVDKYPLDDRNFYTCSGKPRHVGAYTRSSRYRMPYDCFFGNVQAFTGEQYSLINGYGNTFYGYGGEDDDLLRRIWARNLTLDDRYPVCVARLASIDHGPDRGNPSGKYRMLGMRWRPDVYVVDGLNSIRYELVSFTEHRLYTRLTVRLFDPDEELFNRIKQLSYSNSSYGGEHCRR